MGIFSRFENRMEDTVDAAASRMSKAPISPVQIAKKAEKQMRRETMVGAGKEFAPTLYTVLVNPDDDARLFGYYPTLAGETETYLKAKAMQEGLVMDGNPLVRFIVDDGLRHGKFDVIAETVAAPIIAQLRQEEMQRYGIAPGGRGKLPYVPEEEIDRSIDYGEYTFNSTDFDSMEGSSAYNELGLGTGAAAGALGGAAGALGGTAGAGAAGAGAGAMGAGAAGAGAGAMGAAGAGAATHGAGADRAAHQPNTVAFTGNAAGGPDYRKVRARLINRNEHRPYDLGGSVIILGRDNSCDIVVHDLSASRRHAELRQNNQGLWVLTDLGSTNGTQVNSVNVASKPLRPGDIITIGKTDFQFVPAE